MKRSNLNFFFFSSKKKKLGISKSRVLTGNKSASPQLIPLSRTHRAKDVKGSVVAKTMVLTWSI